MYARNASAAPRTTRYHGRALAVALTLTLTACGDDAPAGDAGASGDAQPQLDGGAGSDAGPTTPPANDRSPLGTNLSGLRDWSTEWPFVDAFRTSRVWISGSAGQWDDGRALDLDEHGWVRSLQTDQIARTLLFWGAEPNYPGGRYVVLYDGTGTLEYFGGATRDDGASAPGRHVLDVDPTAGGIGINIMATDAGDPLRNLRVIVPGGACSADSARFCDAETPCGDAGSCVSFEDDYAAQIFHPLFLERIRTYKVLRFMDWMDTNGSEQSTWADRPQVDDARWSIAGAPVELMVALANRLHADPWFTVPHLADDAYVTQLATYLRDHVDPSLRVYVEHSNEVWNGQFAQATYARDRGLELGLSSDAFQAQLLYHSQRSLQIFQIFETVFGDADRLVRVMASQAANPWVSTQVLDFGDALAHTDALAIAPYFGGYLGGPSEQARVAAMSVDELVTELRNEALPTAAGWMTEQAAVAAARGVRLIAYEGGQHLAGNGGVENDETINALFDAVNRDARMGELYADYLAAWKTAGGELFAHFVNCGGYSKWGRWGALEYLDQPRAAAPKYDALQSFIVNNTQWW